MHRLLSIICVFIVSACAHQVEYIPPSDAGISEVKFQANMDQGFFGLHTFEQADQCTGRRVITRLESDQEIHETVIKGGQEVAFGFGYTRSSRRGGYALIKFIPEISSRYLIRLHGEKGLFRWEVLDVTDKQHVLVEHHQYAFTSPFNHEGSFCKGNNKIK